MEPTLSLPSLLHLVPTKGRPPKTHPHPTGFVLYPTQSRVWVTPCPYPGLLPTLWVPTAPLMDPSQGGTRQHGGEGSPLPVSFLPVRKRGDYFTLYHCTLQGQPSQMGGDGVTVGCRNMKWLLSVLGGGIRGKSPLLHCSSMEAVRHVPSLSLLPNAGKKAT